MNEMTPQVSSFVEDYKPDILDTISNLSNDEVFTPPALANRVLDLLPEELWSNPDIRVLDPFCKTGIFLREAAKRFMTGLEHVIPDENERRRHIFRNQLYGCAITELTWLMSRRSLYGTKDASSWVADRLTVKMDRPEGNIIFPRREHDWDKNGKCRICGIGNEIEREGRENHAYALIHGGIEEEFADVQFDVIIGNPPYQANVGVEKKNFAVPLYHHFVRAAKQLTPRYLSMIIPARWFAGGRGLDDFRDEMLSDTAIKLLTDHVDAADCFPGVSLKGGACFFLRDANYRGPCKIRTIHGEEEETSVRYLLENGMSTFIRFQKQLDIVKKVSSAGLGSFSDLVSSQTPYGLHTSYPARREKAEGDVDLFRNGGMSYCSLGELKNAETVFRHKVLLPMAGCGSASYPINVIGKPLYSHPGSACTQTYLVIGPYETKEECENCISFMKTRFFRMLVSAKKVAQHNMRHVFEFVPDLPMTERWTDERLYEKFDITAEEQAFINTMIREM